MLTAFIIALCFYWPTHKASLPNTNPTTSYQSKASASLANQQVSLKQKIRGVWGDEVSDNIAFEIDAKTIRYVDNQGNYKYRLSGNKMTIFYSHNTHTYDVHVKNDTLTMYSKAYGLSRYWRVKE